MNAWGALWRKDLQVLHNLGRLLRRQSLFKMAFVLCFGVGLLTGFFLLFLDGFAFLARLGGPSFLITRRLFTLAYFSLGAMLFLSSLVTSYSTLFRSRETAYLLTVPMDMRGLVTYKSLQSTALASWAFFCLLIPFTAAYGRHERLGPTFALWTLVFAVPFVLLCAGLGTTLSLLVLRWLPRPRPGWLVGGMAAAGLLLLVRPPAPMPPLDESSLLLHRVLPGLRLAAYPLAPSWWTAEGIMALTRGQVGRGLMFWLALTSNTLMVGLLIREIARWMFFPAYQRTLTAAGRFRRAPAGLEWLRPVLGGLPREVRGLVLKDLRTFLRDPLQWSQALIFFGLLALYFASFRSLRFHRLPDAWRNLIVFLNIFSVASVICSLASRFVYPQLSLEGQGFWVLGLAPSGMRRVLLIKFLLALTAMGTVSLGLMGLATHMLQVGPGLRAVALGLAAAIALAVSALATGLGAVFLELKQSNPVAIISGFGGTLNLVLSLAFMLAVVLPFALVWHGHVLGRLGEPQFLQGQVLAATWAGLLTVLATSLPLWVGQRSLCRREY